MADSPFADRLIEGVRRVGSPLCVGIDPFPEHIPPLFGDARSDVRAVEAFCMEILEQAGVHAAVVKPQLGFFEPYGADGYALAQRVTREAQAKGLIVLLDAKRGDIGSTAEGYARAMLGAEPGFDADCVTVNPYLGRDSLEPFYATAQARAKGVAVLVRTSNPGAADVQSIRSDGEPVWRRVAAMLHADEARLRGASGWSGLMAVAGATWPAEAAQLREALPHSLFLIPGYGAQGAGAKDAVAGFVRGERGLEGGIVSSSRAVLYPKGAREAASLDAWRGVIRAAMQAAQTELAQACN